MTCILALGTQADSVFPTQSSGYRSLEEGQEVFYELHPQRQEGWRLTATRIEVKGWAPLSEVRRQYT
jgi:hypothetical protein